MKKKIDEVADFLQKIFKSSHLMDEVLFCKMSFIITISKTRSGESGNGMGNGMGNAKTRNTKSRNL